ncbi:hypothetical protein QQF64_008007 [Cirrhinus molitorella]|uniref:Uncharacterized protein n=1 Tax=Cirrhinus molitorella TaxID=172907 RepID=A0ABR3M4Z0_9TELE
MLPQGGATPYWMAVFIFQDRQYLEDYGFINICHRARCDDVCLIGGFCCGLDDDIRFVLPQTDPQWTLLENIVFVLQVEGILLTVDKADFTCDIRLQPHPADVSQLDPVPNPLSPRSTELLMESPSPKQPTSHYEDVRQS